MVLPLMPKATAIWLIENTALTFDQIANFCSMHPLEVKGIADGEVAQGIIGQDPVETGQLTREEITKCEKNPKLKLAMSYKAQKHHEAAKKKSSRYTPIARRHDKPDAVYWLLKNCPGITDLQIVKLVGTTKNTIESIRNKSHWNMQHIRPRDPVFLGISTQDDLDKIMAKVALANKATEDKPTAND
ncbi:hypothetical protein SZ25_00821 [Candidatus Arcanobacter lacustris]|jgi:hypothetical protein|uniref:Cytoplasmic protein n=1 Tax=Candidatus Arcanibacter lacustris TaxID=1607817 RepID=A0A0F5MN04_9RICK|nr:hypothetical protein SZ25_00821 [Candidatus Arcanobacter lacustris]